MADGLIVQKKYCALSFCREVPSYDYGVCPSGGKRITLYRWRFCPY